MPALGPGFTLARRRGRLSGLVEAPEAPAILALAAAMGEAGRAVFPLLQSQPPRAVTDVTDSCSFAVRALPVRFHRSVNPSFPGRDSFLAPGTEIRTPIPLAQPSDFRSATPAVPPFTLKDAKVALVAARLAVGGHEVRKRRPLIPDRGPQNLPDRSHEGLDFFPAQAVTASRRAYLCTKQRLANIDVTKAGDPALVQKKGLDLTPAAGDQWPEPLRIEASAQGVLPQTL